VVRRHPIPSDERRLAVSRRHSRSVLSSRCRLEHGRADIDGANPPSAPNGLGRSRTGSGTHAPLGPRQPVCGPRLSSIARGTRRRVPHVEKGQRLRQRRDGAFLRVPENGSSYITRRSKREPRRGRKSSNGSKGSITAMAYIRRLALCRRSNTNARSELLNRVSVFGGED
jgi:hypothetical protein